MSEKARAVPEREEVIRFPEADEESWRQYFVEFREKVWPMFREHGFTPAEAWAAWQQEKILGELRAIYELLDDERT